MKFISKLYRGYYVDIDFIVSPRTSDPQANKPTDLITRYESKIGNVSLIFDPTVYIRLTTGAGVYKMTNEKNTANITFNLCYRFAAGLRNIYDQLSDNKLFHMDGGMLYVDHNRANEIGRRISLYNDVLVMLPAAIPGKENKFIKGVSLFINDRLIGHLTHSDILSVIEIIEHFDMTTYTLLTALVDKMEQMDSKLDYTNQQIDEINRKLNMLLEANRAAQPIATVPLGDKNPMNHVGLTSGFNWESVS